MVRVFHHVIIGNDQKLAVCLADDNTGTCGFTLSCKGLPVESLYFLCEVIVDRYDGRHDLVDNSCQLCIGRLCIGDDQTCLVLDPFRFFKSICGFGLRRRGLCCLSVLSGLCFLSILRGLCCSGILCRCSFLRLCSLCRLLFCLRLFRLRLLCGRRLCRFFLFLFTGDRGILVSCGVRNCCLCCDAVSAYIAVHAPEACADACAKDNGEHNSEESFASSA